MKRSFFLALLLAVSCAMPAAAQPATPNPKGSGNGQVGTGAVVLPPLPTTATGSGGAPTSAVGGNGGVGQVQMLCPPAGASVTQPFFTGTDLTCAPPDFRR